MKFCKNCPKEIKPQYSLCYQCMRQVLLSKGKWNEPEARQTSEPEYTYHDKFPDMGEKTNVINPEVSQAVKDMAKKLRPDA